MRVSSKAAGSLRVSSTANEVRLRFSNTANAAPSELDVDHVELNETRAHARSGCAWNNLNKDVLRLIAAQVSPGDRGRMRLVCRQWAQRVSVTDNDAERIVAGIARQRQRRRAERIAQFVEVKRKFRVPLLVACCLLAVALFIIGTVFTIESLVPESFSYIDANCEFDSPLNVVAFQATVTCCKGCDKVTRYLGVASVNNGTAALLEYDVCEHKTATQAVEAIRTYAIGQPGIVPCLSWTANRIPIASIADYSLSTLLSRALWLGKQRQTFVTNFIVGIMAYFGAVVVGAAAMYFFKTLMK